MGCNAMVKNWTLDESISLCVWCSAVAYMFLCVYGASEYYQNEIDQSHLSAARLPFGTRRDTSDFEWQFWNNWFKKIFPLLIGHIILSQFLRKHKSARKYIFLTYSVIALCILLGWKALCVVLMQCFIIYLAACTASSVLVWIVSFALISTLNISDCLKFYSRLIDGDDDLFDLLILTTAMSHLRYTSFAVELVWDKTGRGDQKMRSFTKYTKDDKGKNESIDTNNLCYSFIDMLVFVLYLPLYCTGPLLTFNLFRQQYNEPYQSLTKHKIIKLLRYFARIIFWAFICEVFVHLFYFSALMHQVELLEKMPLWTLAGVGYIQGQFFMVKYIVFFGLPAVVSQIDRFDLPTGPHCISHIYSYSEMWRLFDKGLYSFIKRYLYVPLGGSQKGLMRLLSASLICFIFIFIWHGSEKYIFVWTVMNFLGVLIEQLGKLAERTSAVQRMILFLTPTVWKRLRPLFIVPVFASSILGIFTFFGGTEVGWVYFNRLILNGWPVPILTMTSVLYCVVVSSDALKYTKLGKTD